MAAMSVSNLFKQRFLDSEEVIIILTFDIVGSKIRSFDHGRDTQKSQRRKRGR